MIDPKPNSATLKPKHPQLKTADNKLAILKGKCVDDPITHEERLKRRKDEIDSLKEALDILNDMGFLQKKA
jgi:hypothetical protein